MRFISLFALSMIALTSSVLAQMTRPLPKDIRLSIYNNNLALVKDVRSVPFEKGVNDISFVGVASSIKPSSVMISGNQIRVLEQNYDYALLTPYNILEKSVGTQVQTIKENPTTGENIMQTAELISYQNGEPVLLFDYGIEPNFNGRIVLDKLPEGLSQKPTLAAKISSQKAETKDLTLAYLTNGISWKTDYVAGVKNENTLDLTGWVTISNNSGVSYENASIQLIAGEVNETRSYDTVAPRYMLMKASGAVSMDASNETYNVAPESFSAYQLYTLPNRTTIKDNQTKQLSLIERNGVRYQKEGRLVSELYFSEDEAVHFEKKHPEIYYIIENKTESNLGIPLPKGTMRFYEKDSKDNLQFIGENSIKEAAKGEKLELKLGSLFDVFADGKLKAVRKISEDILKDSAGNCPRYQIKRAYDAEVIFKNGGDKEVEVVFSQFLPFEGKVVKESVKGKAKNGGEYKWTLTLAPNKSRTLTYTIEAVFQERRCH